MRVYWLVVCALCVMGPLALSTPVAANDKAVQPASVWALNERGQVIGKAWATPIQGGYVTVRALLAGAHRAEIVEGERKQPVTQVFGDSDERNLVVVGTAITPDIEAAPEDSPAIEPGEWQVHCEAGKPIPVKEGKLRDLPTFGIAYTGRTAHGDTISGCPVWDEKGQWQGVVVWESPMARPSVVVVPSAYVRALAKQPAQPWEDWRARQGEEGVRYRDSLLLEALQEIWRGQYSNALEGLSLIVEKNPRDGRVWYYRGYAKAMSGDRRGAMEDYEQAVFYDPKNADAHFSLGFTYMLMRREIEAREQAKELDDLDELMAAKLRILIDAMSERPPADPLDGLEVFGEPDDPDAPDDTAPEPEPAP
jgi:hypothetical protein